MPETNFSLPDVISEIFRENKKTFMTLKQTVFHMPAQAKRNAGIFGLTNAAEMQRIIAPLLDNRYVFYRRGTFIYILEPKPHEEFVLDAIKKRPQTPKNIARFVPFTKKECSLLIAELINQGKLIIKVDEDLQVRIYINDNERRSPTADANKAEVPPESDRRPEKSEPSAENKRYAEYTVENFRNAFHSLDNGRVFVKIPDLRKTLGWPRNIFDSALIQLRDAKLVQLHTGDISLMTPEEIKDCFIDENNFRMGTVTWHGR